jgi:hypothetical protein
LKYIFLSYINRSGSTYLANLLSKSPEICVCPEAEILYEFLLLNPGSVVRQNQVKKLQHIFEKDKKLTLWNISFENIINQDKTYISILLTILERFQQIHYPHSNYIFFKHNYLINYIKQFNSKDFFWINLIRDPRGIYASQKNTISPITKKPMSRNVLSFIDNWNKQVNQIKQVKGNSDVIILRYEDFIESTDEVMENLTLQLNLKDKWSRFKYYPPQLTKWISSEYKLLHTNIDDIPKSASLNKWEAQLNKIELEILHNKSIQNQFYPEIGKIRQSRFIGLYILLLRCERKIIYLKAFFIKWFSNNINSCLNT